MKIKPTLKPNKNSIERAMKIELSPNVLELSGIIKLPKKVNIKGEYMNHIMAKYSK